jgi:hypothetical protein
VSDATMRNQSLARWFRGPAILGGSRQVHLRTCQATPRPAHVRWLLRRLKH